MQKTKKGHNSAMKSPMEKEKKYGSANFSLNVKILSLTILDHMQSVIDAWTDRQAQSNMHPKLLRSTGNKKKDNLARIQS